MEWYWIVLIVLGYLVIGGVVAGLFRRMFEFSGEEDNAVAIIWPIILPFVIVAYIADWVREW